MFGHAPQGYVCPFCVLVAGGDNEAPYSVQSDVVLRTGKATAFISSTWWPNNPGHVLVVPDAHVENLYDLKPEVGAEVLDAARRVALAFKAVYRCGGVSTRQHNEPAGGQEVWHYHVHVFPGMTPTSYTRGMASAARCAARNAPRTPRPSKNS